MFWIDTNGSKKSWEKYELRKLFNFLHKLTSMQNCKSQIQRICNMIICLHICPI